MPNLSDHADNSVSPLLVSTGGRVGARPSRGGVRTGTAHGRLLDAGAAALFLGLAFALLWRPILLGGSLDDQDIVLQSIPAYSWYAEALREGRFPIWSTDILGGFPLAFGQYSFFYPPDALLFRLLDASRAFHLSLALHLALAGLCSYWYCRVVGMRRLPALLAGVAFQMGNEALAWPANGFITRTLFVLPALLALVELLLRGRPRCWLLLPLAVAAALLGGYPQILLFALAAAAVYVVPAAASRWREEPRRAGAALALLAAGVALGFGLAAARVAPTLALTSVSMRASGLGIDRSAVDSIGLADLVAGYLLPALTELPRDPAARPDYVGGPALVLAALALASGRLGRIPAFHSGLSVVAAALSLGSNTPLYGLLLQLPFFGYFRGPNRLSFLAAFGIAVLAAHALDRRLASGLPALRWRYRTATALAAVAVSGLLGWLALSLMFQFGRDPLSEGVRALAVARGWDALNLLRPRIGLPVLALAAAPALCVACARGWASHRALELSAVALSVATLFVLGWLRNGWLPPEELYRRPAFADALAADSGHRTVAWAPHVMAYNLERHFEAATGVAPPPDFVGDYVRQFLPPNLGMLFGAATADGYEVLQTRRQALFTTYLGSERRERGAFPDGSQVSDEAMTRQLPQRLGFFAAANVGYLINAFPLDDPALQPVRELSLRIYPDRPDTTTVYLYRLRDALPRAFAVPGAEVARSEQEVLETLATGRPDLSGMVLLEENPPPPDGGRLTREGTRVEDPIYGPERVEVRLRTDGSGFLVLMDFMMPGWTATLDGRPVPILAANFAGRAVAIPSSGDHTVVFSYDAPLLREGAILSAASIAVFLVLAVAVGMPPRRRSKVALLPSQGPLGGDWMLR